MEKHKYFNIHLEFDKNKVDSILMDTITKGEKGYVCVIEANNLTVANKDPQFLKVVNNSLVNICDGSNIAMLLGKIYKKPFTSYIGADIFAKYVRMKRHRHYFLGNTPEVLAGMRETLTQIDPKMGEMCYETLPFRTVEAFDYQEIAAKINADNPDIIWVSLGAPKQELFMSRLLPFLNRGVMLGIGAVFNFNAGTVSPVQRAPKWMLSLKMEWLYRAFEEPKKNIPRYYGFIRILPTLWRNEVKRARMSSTK